MLANTTLPAIANPAAIETRFASAIPTLKSLLGNLSPNNFVFRESVVSAPRQTMLGSLLPVLPTFYHMLFSYQRSHFYHLIACKSSSIPSSFAKGISKFLRDLIQSDLMSFIVANSKSLVSIATLALCLSCMIFEFISGDP